MERQNLKNPPGAGPPPNAAVRRSDRRHRGRTAVVAPQQPAPSLAYLQDVFRDRCEARATLVAEGEMDFQEAIDGLQAAAVEYGLVAKLGQDAVQAAMAAAFAKVPRPGELEDAIAAMADFLDGFSIEMASKPRSDAPRCTIDAVSYLIKQNDPQRLRAFLANHTAQERLAIQKHFERRK